MQDSLITDSKSFGAVLLETGVSLLQSGASCNRINIIISRMAAAYQYTPYLNIGPKYVSLTLHATEGNEVFNETRNSSGYGINFTLVSGINGMSKALEEKKWPINEIRNELSRLKNLPHYPRMVVLFAVALAGASFCYLFGGDVIEMSISFGATFCGLWVKQELLKRSLNTYLCTFISALTAALFTGAFYKAGLGIELEHAYSTCVLFLIPGVPLINFFTDLFAGNILFGIDRGVSALMHIMAISFALAAAIVIYNFQT